MSEKLTKKEKKRPKKEALSSMTAGQRKKYYLTRICIVTLVVFVVLFVICIAAKFVSDSVTDDLPTIEQISEVYPTYTPFPAEWSADLSKDEEYLALNTDIMYGEGNSGSLYSLEEFFSGGQNEGQRFFSEYFRILREGDFKKYPGLFTNQYKSLDAQKRFEKNVEREFPPQRVHDITVREIGRYRDEEKNIIYGIYHVDYKINKNSNLFRNDIGWNSELGIETSRPLYFELVTYNAGTDKEQTLISNMYTESTMKAYALGEGNPEE